MKNDAKQSSNQTKSLNGGTTPKDLLLNTEWLSNILLSMGEGIIATDTEGRVTMMNHVAEELTGWTNKESQGKPIDSIFDAINEETMSPIENPIRVALKENKIVLLANHTILIKKDKTQRVIVDSAVPIHGDDASIVGGALVFRDVTEMSRAKKTSPIKEDLAHDFLDNTSLLISIKDLSGRYLLINKQKEKVFNINAESLIGKSSIAHMTKARANFSRKMDQRVIESGRQVEYNESIEHPDSGVHFYHTAKFPLYENGVHPFAICTVSVELVDSSLEYESALTGNKRTGQLTTVPAFEEFAKNMPNLFFSLDRDLVHTSFNVACETFTGISADKVIGHTMEEAFPSGDPLFLAEYKDVLESGIAKNFITTFSFNDRSFTYIVNIFPTEKGVSVLMTDLTIQNQTNEKANTLINRLQQKNKDLRQFAYAFSHDLRAPIARVLGLVSLSELDPDIIINDKSIMENVASEVKSLDEVVKDISLGIDVDQTEQVKEFINFNDLFLMIKTVLEKEIIESGAELKSNFILQEGVFSVKSYLYSIMLNLLSNAIKFRQSAVPLKIEIASSLEGSMIILSVKDNGRGIDLVKYKDLVFGLRNRFHSKDVKGTGIGLHLVKSQIESLGGKVSVQSEVNKGSMFKVFFPINKKLNVSGE